MTRFAGTARATVASAVGAAQRDGSAEIREEHLLAAVLDSPDGARVLAPLSDASTRAQAFEDIARSRRSGGYTAEQRDALSAYGLDLDALVSQAEAQLGEGALDERARRRSGGPKLSPAAAGVLDRAARAAEDDSTKHVDVTHLALGLAASRGVVGDVLSGHGLSVATVRAAIHTDRTGQGR